MSTPEAFETLVTQIIQELDHIHQTAQYCLKLIREKLLESPNEAELTQLFVIFNNILFFTENYRGRIQSSIKAASEENLNPERLQDLGQDLATLLGVVLEAKLLVEHSVSRLSKLPWHKLNKVRPVNLS